MIDYKPLDLSPIRHDSEVVLSLLLEQQPKKVIEIGCGTGHFSIELAKRDWDVTGTDIHPKAVEVSKSNAKQAGVNITFVEADLFEDVKGRFDVIAFNPPLVFSLNPLYPYARGFVARIPLLNNALERLISYLPNAHYLTLMERFFDGVKAHLTSDGCVYLTILNPQLPPLKKHFTTFKAIEAGSFCKILIIAKKHL